eukprot:6138406-Pyramimonas_sp.AAC.1
MSRSSRSGAAGDGESSIFSVTPESKRWRNRTRSGDAHSCLARANWGGADGAAAVAAPADLSRPCCTA